MMLREQMRGAEVDLSAWAHLPVRALLFGEAQGRVIVTTSRPADVLVIARRHAVPAMRIGTVRGSSRLQITVEVRTFSAALSDLAAAYHDAIPRIMARTAAVNTEPELAGAPA